MLIRTLFVLALSWWVIPLSQAHEVETCLMALAQRAQDLRTCQVGQTRAEECDTQQYRMNEKAAQCRQQEFPQAHIERAISYGNSLVKGDTAQSPYHREVTRQRWEHSQMRPNVERFEHLFTDYGALQGQLTERFGTRKCPKAYEGSSNRWIYTGPVSLVRYSLASTGEEPRPRPWTLHLFAPERDGECYPAQAAETESPHKVVNIPETLLTSLAAKGEAVKCSSPDCEPERHQLLETYQRYQQDYRRYRQLLICVDFVEKNEVRGSIKGMRRSKIILPGYCPDHAVRAGLVEARERARSLDQALFESGGNLTNVTKSE